MPGLVMFQAAVNMSATNCLGYIRVLKPRYKSGQSLQGRHDMDCLEEICEYAWE